MMILHVLELGGEYVKGSLFWQALAWVIHRVIPTASPDYIRHLRAAAYWLVEVDDNGRASRDISFTAQHEPILFTPTNRNYGLWTDSDRLFSLEEFKSRKGFPFEAT